MKKIALIVVLAGLAVACGKKEETAAPAVEMAPAVAAPAVEAAPAAAPAEVTPAPAAQ